MLHDFLSGFFRLTCVHPCCMHQHFIALYGGIFHCMGTPYFVCTNGHFGCFYILAIVNKAYKHLCTSFVSTAISVLLVIFLPSRLLVHMAVLLRNFLRKCQNDFQSSCNVFFTFPPASNTQVSVSPHSYQPISLFSHASGCELVSLPFLTCLV